MKLHYGIKNIFLILLTVTTAALLMSCNSGNDVPRNELDLVDGAMVPAGSVLPHGLVLPAGTFLTGGYLLPDSTYVPPVVFDVERSLAEGTVLLGDMVIPAGTLMPDDTLLPGGRKYGSFDATLGTVGIVIQSGLYFSSDTELQGGTILSGSMSPLESELTFPAGTVFSSGYTLPDGTVMPESASLPYTLDSEETLPAGTVIMGGTVVPDGEVITIPAGVTLPGPVVLDGDLTISGNGITIPAGVVLPSGVHVPRGAYFPDGLALPDGSSIYRGWIRGDTSAVQPAVSATSSFDATAGSIIIGETIIPESTAALASELYLPPGTSFDLEGKPEDTSLMGAAIPPASAFDATTAGQAAVDIPAGTLFTGSGEPLARDITFPAGTIFYGGYYDSSLSSTVAPLTAGTDITLHAGDRIIGGVTLPDSTSGVLTVDISTPFSYGGAIVIPGCYDQPEFAGAAGIYLPAGTYSESGIDLALAGADDVAAGETLSTAVSVEPGDTYYVPVELGSPLAAATADTAAVTWNTSASATEEIRYSKVIMDSTSAAWDNCLDSTDAAESSVGVACIRGCYSGDCGTVHSLDIPGLDSDTRYYFRIYIGGSGQCGSSTNNSSVLKFATAPACAGGFALVTVSNEESSSVGSFGQSTAMASLADFKGRLYLGSSKEQHFNMYKTDTSYGTVTTQGITLDNENFNEIWDMESAVLDGNEYLFSIYSGMTQSFMLYYSTGDFVGTDLDLIGISYDTGSGTASIPPTRQGFGAGSDNQHDAKVLYGGDGYIYLGTSFNSIARLYVATTLATDVTTTLVAYNFSDDSAEGDIFWSKVGDVGTQVSALAEYNNRLYVSVKNPATGAKLFSTPVTDRKNPEWTRDATFPGNDDISSLTTSSDGSVLFIGTENSSGAQIWIYDTTGGFQKIADFADGTGLQPSAADTDNTRVNFIIENGPLNRYIYFGTQKASAGFEVWRSGTAMTAPFIQMGAADSGTCSSAGAADSFGSVETFINARRAESIRIGTGPDTFDRLFVSVQTVPSGDIDGTVRVYRIDNN